MSETLLSFGGLWLSAFTSATILPGTSDAALVFLLTRTPEWVAYLVATATIGNGMGSALSYFMGRALLKGARQKHEKVWRYVEKWGSIALLFSWLPFIGDALALAAGWFRLPFWRSVLLMTTGKLLRYLFITGSYFLFQHYTA